MAKQLYQDCQNGDLEAVEKYLSSDADAKKKINELVFDDGLGFQATPLHAAIESGNERLIRTLLQHGGNPSLQDGQKYTCLMLACSLGRIDVVRLLMGHGVQVMPAKQSGLKSTPLHEAVMSNNVEIVETLLNVEPKLLELTDGRSWTALHYSCQYGKCEVAKVLVDKGANIDAQIDIRRTPLHLAGFEGYDVCVEYLLKNQADPNVQSEGNWTPLILAAQEGKTKCVELLLADNRTDFNLRASNGRNALHSASFYGRTEIAKMLVDKGIECHVPDKDQWTQLHLCAQEKHPEIVRYILEHGRGIQINAKSHNGRTPLHSASLKGCLEAARILLEFGAALDEVDNKEWTALHVACQHGHTGVAEFLLKQNADPNQLISMGRNALHLAAFEGHLAITKLLLDNGVIPTVPDKDRWTALHLAVQEGKTEIAKLIMGCRGIALDAQAHNGRTPLHSACFYGRKELVRELLNHGASTYLRDEKGWSQLHLAAQEAHEDIVEILVKMGAPVNVQSDNQRTPIHLACMKGNNRVIQFLLDHGADQSIKDSKGWSCLHVALHHNRLETFKLLMKAGAPVNAQMDDGRTCLHMAMTLSSFEYMEQLIQEGAAIDIKDKNGLTPLHVAVQSAHRKVEMVGKLLNDGADVNAENAAGKTPLMLAVGDIALLNKLLDNHAKVNAADSEGMTALHYACRNKSVKGIVEELIKRGADVEAKMEREELTPLHIACQKGSQVLSGILLDNGADINASTPEGLVPVHFAIQSGVAAVVTLLVDRGANLKVLTSSGRSAIHFAGLASQVEVISMLWDKVENPVAKDNKGWTVLHVASGAGHDSVIKFYLDKGGDIQCRTEDGMTALHIAAEKSSLPACEILIKNKIDVQVG